MSEDGATVHPLKLRGCSPRGTTGPTKRAAIPRLEGTVSRHGQRRVPVGRRNTRIQLDTRSPKKVNQRPRGAAEPEERVTGIPLGKPLQGSPVDPHAERGLE